MCLSTQVQVLHMKRQSRFSENYFEERINVLKYGSFDLDVEWLLFIFKIK